MDTWPPLWPELPVFNFPGISISDTPLPRTACAVLVHGIDGVTYPQLLDSSESLPVFVTKKVEFRYNIERLVGESASYETIGQVAIEFLDFLSEIMSRISGSIWTQWSVGSGD
ncbi:hypothetical protein GGR51DRAFT_554809 [Nemania sp. FL0031]|nr:hypothetical protein GGR51DRAFT_554809 [Nemania sp. FL0031]